MPRITSLNKRRSLFVTGCLMAVFVVFASKAAFAQDDAAEVTVLEVDPRSHDELRVDWKWAATNSDTADIEGFSLRYQEGAAFVNTKSIMRMDVDFNKDDDDYRVILEELKPDTEYIVGVTAIAKDAGDMDSDEMTSTGTTDPADEPDDVRNLMLHVGDSMIMAMWDEATDNGSEVTGYEVQIKESDESDSKYESVRDGDDDDTSTEWAISNLENGMEYSVRVRAYCCAMIKRSGVRCCDSSMIARCNPCPCPKIMTWRTTTLTTRWRLVGRRDGHADGRGYDSDSGFAALRCLRPRCWCSGGWPRAPAAP